MKRLLLLIILLSLCLHAQQFTNLVSGAQLAGDPTCTSLGQYYFNTTSAVYRVCVNVGLNTWSNMGSASILWSQLQPPGGNLALTMGTNTSVFTIATGTGTSDMFVWQDTTGNTGTGSIARFSSVGTSTMKPFTATAQGTANGVQMNSSGLLAAIGTGGIAATQLNGAGVPTSAVVLGSNGSNQLVAAALTGSGSTVALATSPVLTTPNIGVATATSVNKITITQPATGSTLTLADGKTVTVNNTLTLAGSDGTTLTFQGTDTYVSRTSTDTLTNKTLTTPKITVINDQNGNPFIQSTATGSAVDSLTITNAATANPATVTIAATGVDANINLNLVAKGGGVVQCNGGTCGGGGGGGASNFTQLNDFQAVKTSSSVLTIGQNCTSAMPCTVAIGTASYQFAYTNPNYATCTISAGSATVYAYVDPASKAVTCGSNGDTLVGANGAVIATGISGFPPGAAMIAEVTASSGAYVTLKDDRAAISGYQVVAGLGLSSAVASGVETLTLDTAYLNTNYAKFSAGSFTTLAFSATPTFTYLTGANTFKITLTGNVTSSTVAASAAGQVAIWVICQDNAGSHTFAWPANFFGAMTIGSTASKCNIQPFTTDGTNYYALSTGLLNQ